MLSFHLDFESIVREQLAPERVLPLLLTRAAHRQGIVVTDELINDFAAQILASNDDAHSIELDDSHLVAWGGDRERLKHSLQALIDDLNEHQTADQEDLLEAVETAGSKALIHAGQTVYEAAKERLFEHAEGLHKARVHRQTQVEEFWKSAIDRLEVLRHAVEEWAQAAEATKKGAFSTPYSAAALGGLIARAVATTGEVAVLCRNGYPDGALARWRSLHEVCVVAALLSAHGEPACERYVLHERIESTSILQTANDRWRPFDVADRRKRANLAKQRLRLLERFGPIFSKSYGWAVGLPGVTSPQFDLLEKAVGLSKVRGAYKLANSAVHAGPLGTFGNISTSPRLSAGDPRIAVLGCGTAISYSAASLTLLVAEVGVTIEIADLVILNVAISTLHEEICELVEYTHRRADMALAGE